MTRRIGLVALLAAFLFPSAVAEADNPRLVGLVGTNDAFVISLRDGSGNLVTHLDPGTYDVAISDKSDFHNFHLSGPGVNRKTGVATRGHVTWNVTLRPGTYTYRSDKTKKLRGSFTVKLPF